MRDLKQELRSILRQRLDPVGSVAPVPTGILRRIPVRRVMTLVAIYDGWGSDTVTGGAGTDTLYRCNDNGVPDSISGVENLVAASSSYCKNRNFDL